MYLKKLSIVFFTIYFMTKWNISYAGWGFSDNPKKAKLTDIQVLTLKHGQMTKGRRSSPVPQLECVNGGTAPCSVFIPKVVQCVNKGSDGYDVQWECKTDMDNAFRFGDIGVSCEGYDYPDDPYVLHGSCGLRYTIDYTKEGEEGKQKHNYYGNSHDNYDSYSSHSTPKYSSMKSGFLSNIADLVVYLGIGLMIYVFYKTCISSGRDQGETAYSSTDDDSPNSGGGGGRDQRGSGYGWFGGTPPTAPPYSGYDDASCRNRGNRGSGTGGGGFWTGAATGGLLGYMFGNRNNYNQGAYNRGWGGGSSSGYGGYSRPSGGGFFSSSSTSGNSSSSSGTRTASGFGGTSRR